MPPGKYGEAKEGWDNIGPLAFFHREKDEVGKKLLIRKTS